MLSVLILVFASALLLFSLLVFGAIGPCWLKRALRCFNRWYFNDTAPFTPIDPYKPLGTEIKQRIKHFWATPKRVTAMRLQVKLIMFFLSFAMVAALVVALWLNTH